MALFLSGGGGMSLWSRLGYSCTDYKRMIRIELRIDIKSQSDATMLTNTFNIDLDDENIHNVGYNGEFDIRRSIAKENGDLFNDIAQYVLEGVRKKKIVTMDRGILLPGDYLVACEWRVFLRWHKLTYKEYLEEVGKK